VAYDTDEGASKVYEANLGLKPLNGDLSSVSGRDILKEAGFEKGDLPLVVGCPPCQSFSSLRKTTLGKRKDDRKGLLKRYADLVAEMLPKAAVLENVSGLSYANRWHLDRFVSTLKRAGYMVAWDVVDASDYGVPQRRRRVVAIASRVRKPALPARTHRNPKEPGAGPRWRTVKDAIAGLPPLQAGEASPGDPLHFAPDHGERTLRLIRSIPRDGGSRRDLPPELWLPCHAALEKRGEYGAGSSYGRMKWDEPSPTVTTRFLSPSCGRFVHPSQDRAISIREAARLQTVPDSYGFEGNRTQISAWIGNGMPVDLAEAVARQVSLAI